MNLRLLGAPATFALRRLRARPLQALTLVLVFAGGAALIGWSGLTAALSQEDSVRRELADRVPGARSLQVLYFTLPLEGDFRAPTVDAAFAEFADVTAPSRHLRIWHSIEPGRPGGTRLVLAREPRTEVAVRAGRLPKRCAGGSCEVLALKAGAQLGDRVALGNGIVAVVVGRGSLRPGLLADASELGDRPLLIPSLTRSLEVLVRTHGSTVVTIAALDPDKVHGYALADLHDRLRTEITRLERGDPLVRASAPLALLEDVAHRGEVAADRLLLVSGEGAALIVAFAAFLAAARRREVELVDDQLAVLGASRVQSWTARVTEAFAPCTLGTVLALGSLWIAAFTVAADRGLPTAFVGAALPLQTVLVIVALGVVGSMLLVASETPRSRPRFGLGPLELAAVIALALVVWQAAATGALDPEEVAARGADPLLVLLPALAFFATGVLLLRIVPWGLVMGERLTRRASFGVRLALLTAARNPGQVAAATTFLAIAVGASLFSLDYRATLDRQSRDEAAFTVGAKWRVTGNDLIRLGRVTSERPTPALRLDGTVEDVDPAGELLGVKVLGLPAARLSDVLGWRDGFSDLSRSEIARRLRPRAVKLGGPRLATDATAIRVFAHAQTDYPREIVLHLLLPGQRFGEVRLGRVWRRWQSLRVPVRRELRGAQLVGVEFEPTFTPISFQYDPKGFVDLGRLEQRRGSGWSRLPSLATWTPPTAPTGTAGILTAATFENAPVANGIRFELAGTFQPLIHPTFGLAQPRPGFVTGDVPALAGGPVAARAVDGLVTLEVAGKQLPVRIIGSAELFPTIVEQASDFLVFDYDTLLAALNADQPGLARPSESWLFDRQRADLAAVFGARALAVDREAARLGGDPLAAGTRDVLGVAAIVAAVLGLIGLALATRNALSSERLQLAEYEALGVAPRALRRSAQVRLLAMSAFGILASLLGAFLTLRLIAAFVAVTGTGRRPLPPIESVVAWTGVAGVVGTVVLAGVALAALMTRRSFREPPAGRLRA